MLKRSRTIQAALIGVLFTFAACGSATSGTAPTSSEAATATAPSSGSLSASALPATSSATASAATNTGADNAASAYAVIPQSKTPEGYYVLGEPNAPALMTYYSDFI